MFLDLSQMLFGIVNGAVSKHGSDDFQPTMSQATEGTRMALSFVAVGLIERCGPGAVMSAQVRPQMERGSQPVNARPSHLHAFDLSALVGNRRRARASLHLADHTPVNSCQFHQQPRRQLGASSWQRTEQIVIRMLLEQSLDARSVGPKLLLQSLQQPRQALSQHALSRRDRCSSSQLISSSKDFHPLLGRLRTPQLMGVEELFPFAPPSCDQRRWGRKSQYKGPARRFGPVIKSCQSRWIILLERSLELIDQRCAFFDEADLISAQGAQFRSQGIQGRKSTPAMAVGAQGIGQTPGIMQIILGASWALAFPITNGCFGHDRVHRKAPLQQLIHGRTSTGLNSYWHLGPLRQGLLSFLPACSGVFKSQFHYELTSNIDHDQVVVIVGPVQGRKVREFFPRFHG